MLAQKLDKRKLLQLIGVDLNKVGALARAAKAMKWTLVAIAKSAPPPDSGRFFRSVKDYVDSSDKKSSYQTMVLEICDAIESDDYQASIKGVGSISVKVAHTFSYGGRKHSVWELKCGKKDRIYFYPHTSERLIFLLMAYHKKDQQTPDEVCKACEADIKLILDPQCKIVFC
ncbi:hypothetical protein PQR14_22060 [Paraburkholderia bryophila]|uniref:hypothetical protein n=1 Tax=Paraburkholderia bryophila TaxID=420952 RepID=UPI0038B9E8AF